MRPIHLLILALVGASIALGIAVANKKQQPATPVAPPLAGPPPGASFIGAEVRPEDVIHADQLLVGYWIPEPGWQIAASEVKPEDDGVKSLRIPLAQSNPLFGAMFLVVVVPEETPIREGEFCMVTGRIAEVSQFQKGGITDAYRVIVRDAKLTK
jgi:hypothetical protein